MCMAGRMHSLGGLDGACSCVGPTETGHEAGFCLAGYDLVAAASKGHFCGYGKSGGVRKCCLGL